MTTQAGPSRGHSRNLSASSIGSTASSIGMPDDLRRRPAPLAMANDPNKRAMMSIDTYNPVTGSPGQQYAYFPQSPTGFSTPTSTTFSNGPASPGFTSPSSSISRSSFYNGARHGRRLSVPSGVNPYQNAGYPHHTTALVPFTPTRFILNILNKAASMLVLPVLFSLTAAATLRPNSSSDGEPGIQVLILATHSAQLLAV
jgi:hypothetical protein